METQGELIRTPDGYVRYRHMMCNRPSEQIRQSGSIGEGSPTLDVTFVTSADCVDWKTPPTVHLGPDDNGAGASL